MRSLFTWIHHNNNIRNQLLLGFLALLCLVLILALVAYQQLSTSNQLRAISQNVQKVQTQWLEISNAQLAFLDTKLTDSSEFQLQVGLFTLQNDSLSNQLSQSLSGIIHQVTSLELGVHMELSRALFKLTDHQKLLEKSLKKIAHRGHTNWGMEGKIESLASQIEAHKDMESREILQLQKHQKTFALGKNDEALAAFNQLISQLLAQKRAKQKTEIASLLSSFALSFNQLAQLDGEIGDTYAFGLKNLLFSNIQEINTQLGQASNNALMRSSSLTSNLQYYFFIVVALLTFGGLFISLFIAHRISRPIRQLSSQVSSFKDNQTFKLPEPYKTPDSFAAREVKKLSFVFQEMMADLSEKVLEMKQQSAVMQQKNQELEKVNHELDQFVYRASHDLKAPLTSVLGLLNIIAIDHDEQNRKQALEMVRQSMEKLNQITSDILDYSRNSRMEIRPTPIHFQALIREVYEKLKLDYFHLPVQFHLQTTEAYPFYADSLRVQIILKNLLSNALRYSDPKKPEGIHIWATADITKDGARITVTDNGQGIQEALVDKIFDMFFRGTTNNPGSGLGLYIAQDCCHRLGGKLQVSSTSPKGTTFSCFLPNMKKMGDAKVITLPKSQPDIAQKLEKVK